MLIAELLLLVVTGLVGIVFNWLLILAVQRKTYHDQDSHRIVNPVTNMSLLRPNPSLSGQIIRAPLLPSLRSSISTFDKYILAFLINDIFVCNFIIPLRFIDLSQGLPCAFLCFILKFLERITAIIEIIIINLLSVTSLVFFFKKRLGTTRLYFLCLFFMAPLVIIYLAPTLTHLDIHEYEYDQRPPSCKQIFIYITLSTCKTLNIICCVVTGLIIFIQFILIIQIRWAIRRYKQRSLKNITEAAALTKNVQQEIFLFDQTNLENASRRSMYTPSTHNPSTATSIATDMTPTTQRSLQSFDYLTYLAIMENGKTLIRSTFVLLIIYLLVYTPYWIYELSSTSWSYPWKDLYLLSHILKPFCYMFINEKYLYHVLAILKCESFRMLPNLLRRKSRVVTLNNATANLNIYKN